MEAIILLCILIAVGGCGLFFMKKVDHNYSDNIIRPMILLVSQKQYHIKENLCDSFLDFPTHREDYQYIVLDSGNDLSQLMYIKRLREHHFKGKFYVVCNENDYRKIYIDEKVELIEKNGIKGLIDRLYEKVY